MYQGTSCHLFWIQSERNDACEHTRECGISPNSMDEKRHRANIYDEQIKYQNQHATIQITK